MSASWEQAAKAKREEILASIPQEWRIDEVPTAAEQRDVTQPAFVEKYLTPDELAITSLDAVKIVACTISGKLKAEVVARAFCHRASLAHQVVNCLHETFFDAAISDAQKLDAYFAEHRKPIGPLHGLPISLKDQFHVKDVDTTMGYTGWIGTYQGNKDDTRYRTSESELVRELRALGAVLFCKTSVPHTLMCGETINNIVGYTWNPRNRNLSSGGSSGGEGALISFRGSPAGFGTDIGGSVRIPSAFNGLWGLRPSTGRLPYEGMANSMDGQNSILSVVGPLTTSALALKMLTKAVLSQKPWLFDPLVHEIPWRDEHDKVVEALMSEKSGKLSFGMLKHDGICGLHPPVARAISMVTKALQKIGHEVIEWKPPSHAEAGDLAGVAYDYDGGVDVQQDFRLSGESAAPQVIAPLQTEPVEATASKIAANNVAIRAYRKRYLDYWNSTVAITSTGRPVDALITPLAPFAAARPERYRHYTYSTFVNVIDYPSVVIPVTNADKNIDVPDTAYQPLNETDKLVQDDYDAEIYDGAHVGVQLIGRRLQEEKTIALAEFVGAALQI